MSSYEKPIYLNNGATSWPKPPEVAEAVAEALRSMPGEANRGGVADFDVFAEVRKELAELMGISCPSQIALGPNSTWGLNQAIFGYPLEPGDAVLSTRAEHNAVLRPLRVLEQKGIRVRKLPVDAVGRVSVSQWKQALEAAHPRLCILNHASNVTGAVNDVPALAGAAQEAGAAFLLDVSQTLGCIPVELEQWKVDMAAFTGHKYLLGPQGTGGIYVREGLELTPHMVGGTGVMSDLKEMPREMPLHLEAGTGNEPSFHGLLAALRWRKQHPLDQKALSGRTRRLTDGLVKLGCRVILPGEPSTPVVSFVIPGVASSDAADILTGSYDIVLRSGLHCAPEIMEGIGMAGGTLRFSLSRFTTEEEVEQVLQAVRDVVESSI